MQHSSSRISSVLVVECMGYALIKAMIMIKSMIMIIIDYAHLQDAIFTELQAFHGLWCGVCDNLHIQYTFGRPLLHGPLTRYVKLWVAHAPGMPGTFSPPPRVSHPYMHHGTCVMHAPRCMPGSLTSGFLWRRWRGNVPGIPGACATRNFTYLIRGPCTLGSMLSAITVSLPQGQ